MAKWIALDRLYTILQAASLVGLQRHSLFRTEWDIAGDCENKYCTELYGRPVRKPVKDWWEGDDAPQWAYIRDLHVSRSDAATLPQHLTLWTRCRRCTNCLRTRARRWYGAAIRETKASSRTWFGTLTLSPESHWLALSKARARLAKQGVDFDRLDAAEQFRERHRAISPELTKYIKRVRKDCGAALRYMLVAEKHESGLPHYHMLMHEAPLGGTVSHRTLSTKYTLGFEKWRLADPTNPRSAAYLCKYLSKSLEARVRASQGYGVTTSEMHTYVIEQLRKAARGLPPSTEEASTIEDFEEALEGGLTHLLDLPPGML